MRMLVALLLFSASLVGQTPASASKTAFQIGMTRGEVVRIFGNPQYYDIFKELPLGRKYFELDVKEIYYRESDGNKYRIDVQYRLDYTRSTSGPEIAVGRFRVHAEKPESVGELLRHSPEAKAVCGAGCKGFLYRQGGVLQPDIGEGLICLLEDKSKLARGDPMICFDQDKRVRSPFELKTVLLSVMPFSTRVDLKPLDVRWKPARD